MASAVMMLTPEMKLFMEQIKEFLAQEAREREARARRWLSYNGPGRPVNGRDESLREPLGNHGYRTRAARGCE